MIKGLSKQVYIIKGDDKDIFEQAIFMIKPEVSMQGDSQTDFAGEANKIIGQKIKSFAPRRRKKFGIF